MKKGNKKMRLQSPQYDRTQNHQPSYKAQLRLNLPAHWELPEKVHAQLREAALILQTKYCSHPLNEDVLTIEAKGFEKLHNGPQHIFGISELKTGNGQGIKTRFTLNTEGPPGTIPDTIEKVYLHLSCALDSANSYIENTFGIHVSKKYNKE